MFWSILAYSSTALCTSAASTVGHTLSKVVTLSCVSRTEERREEQKVLAVMTLSCCATLEEGGAEWEEGGGAEKW